MTDHLTIGTRGSALALFQSHFVRDELLKLYPRLDVHVLIIQTTGDKSQETNTPLASYGEKGIFAKELELALLVGEIDLAVHSMKDLSTILPDGLQIAVVPEREDVRDALVGKPLALLLPGDRVGTGSVRRTALLRKLRPDLTIAEIRGNVDTRIIKLKEGQYDAIVLAAAGLSRLSRSSEIAEYLDPRSFVPDPGQGALAIETRAGDDKTNALLAPLNHLPSAVATTAERSFLAEFGGGCQMPVGAWATVSGDALSLIAMAAIDSSPPVYTQVNGLISGAAHLGKQAALALKPASAG